eukprot:c2845_g1_i1.p1 GENE.c2845_g1_i1~~c2845_g1_i1.p1  ORF type:complete len:275 (-),score=25.36 c2845_g1_i1:63-848(-)
MAMSARPSPASSPFQPTRGIPGHQLGDQTSFSSTRDHDVDEALAFEKKLVNGMLNRLFKPGVSRALFSSLYPQTSRVPQFIDSEDSSWPLILNAYRSRHTSAPSLRPDGSEPTSEAWCRLVAHNLQDRHFEKDTFPPFTVKLVKLDGSELPRVIEDGCPKPMADMRIRLSVYNKWSNVSQDVMKDVEYVRTLKDGSLTISDLVFQEISLKHGGYFVLHIDPIDYKSEVLPWKSPKITIQSVKTHSNKKRKYKRGDPETSSP